MGVLRALRGVVAALALLSFGLWIGGATGRVHALVRAAAASPHIAPIAGSQVFPAREVVLDGQTARVARCVAPRTLSLAQVRDHYEDEARHEVHIHGDDELPYIAVDQPDAAYVLWTCAADGHRKGVIATRNAGAIEYTLLDAEALVPVERGARSSVVLPGGAEAPEGARAALSVEEGGSSFTFFEAPGAPATVARELQTSLGRAGFELDDTAAPELEAASQKAHERARIVLPFKGKDKKGFIVIAPSGPGGSRATVVVR